MKFDPLEYLMLAGVDEQTAADWLTLRRAKKSPPTATAINMLTKQANQANMTLTQALELCCMNGWQGFKAEWVAKNDLKPRMTQHQINQASVCDSLFGSPRVEHLVLGVSHYDH